MYLRAIYKKLASHPTANYAERSLAVQIISHFLFSSLSFPPSSIRYNTVKLSSQLLLFFSTLYILKEHKKRKDMMFSSTEPRVVKYNDYFNRRLLTPRLFSYFPPALFFSFSFFKLFVKLTATKIAFLQMYLIAGSIKTDNC